MQGMRGLCLPFFLWGLPSPHRPLMLRTPQRLHLEVHCTVYKSEARDSKSPSGHLAGREQVSPTDWSLPPAMERGPVPQGEWAGETLCEVVWEDGGGAGSMTAPDKCSHSVYSARRPRVPWRPSQDERPAGADDEAHGRAGQAGEQQRAAPDCQCGTLSSRQVRRSGGGHRAGVPLGC